MNLKYLRIVSIAVLVAFTGPALAANDAMVELLKVLRDNRTITEEAYNLLKNSAVADEERTDAKIEETAEKKLASVKQVPDSLKWAEKIKVKGDLRLRREYIDTDPENSESQSRDRYRYRLRLGAEAEVNDEVKIGLGFASGSDDARSVNSTLDDGFSTKDARLDYAFAEWKPSDWVSVVGGKFNKRKDYLWAPTDMIWDGDINPEGASVHLQTDNSFGTAYGNVGHWILGEDRNSSDDPTLTYVQVGHKFKSGNFFGNVAGTYYSFDGLEGASIIAGSGGNNTIMGGTYLFDYDSVGLSAEVGIKDVLMQGKVFAIFGEYIKNDDSDEDTGRAFGFKFGDKKVKNTGTWQFKYINADLEADAFVDFTGDSNRLGGQTGYMSNELIFKYAIAKNIILGLDYYDSEQDVPGLDDDEEKRFQSDIIFKF
ncbi:MAG: putative porin [Gammaproteobacteria bacterium]